MVIGVMFFMIASLLLILFADTSGPSVLSRKKARKQKMDVDDLAPGLNIDLNYYLAERLGQYEISMGEDEKNRLLSD